MSEQILQLPDHFPINDFLRGIASALGKNGHSVRIVGGCLRDFIMGIGSADVDLATTARPDEAMQALENFRIIPTGLSHGTLTLVDTKTRKMAELTSLRRDVITDGRHATVEFGVDWRVDAERRDFTFNALSLDFSGRLFDYVDGYNDAQKRYLRFVGIPDTRISEDALRILRFYRFAATRAYHIDPDSRAACLARRNMLKVLPAERIWQECFGILNHPDGLNIWLEMAKNGILSVLIPEFDSQHSDLYAMAQVEQKFGHSSHAARLAMMGVEPDVFKVRFRPPNTTFRSIRACQAATEKDFTRSALRRHLWSSSRNILSDWLRCVAARATARGNTFDPFKIMLDRLSATEEKPFPVSGADILNRGIVPGLVVGQILENLKEWWVNQDSLPDRTACLKRLDHHITETRIVREKTEHLTRPIKRSY